MPKMITLEPAQVRVLCLQGFDQPDARRLTVTQAGALIRWCEAQRGDLFDEGMSLQECLNVYRVSWEWDTWEGWEQEDPDAARKAWNSAVINASNRLRRTA